MSDKRNKQIFERLLKLTEPQDPNNICTPPMNADVALQELCRYFLGEDWYTGMSMSQKQVNTAIVYEIESKYKGKTWK